MKRKILILTTLLTCMISIQAQKQISTEAELAAINADVNALKERYILMNDITVENWIPIGDAEKPFLGSFDGNGHTITVMNFGDVRPSVQNLKTKTEIPDIQTFYLGLFGFTGPRSVVENLQVHGEIVFESAYNLMAGGITGVNVGTVRNCISVISVSPECKLESDATNPDKAGDCFAGGIAGINKGTVHNCYSSGAITAEGGKFTYAGGIVGLNEMDRGIIQWCYVLGDITSSGSDGERYTGGIAGFNSQGGLVQYCVALNENVLSNNPENSHTGRITGSNFGREGNNFSRRDMVVTDEKFDPKSQAIFEFSSLQEIQWWTENRHIRFAFGATTASPWGWSEELKRPVLHWETGATALDLSRRGRSETPGPATQTPVEIRTVEDLIAIGADLITLKRNYILMDDLTVEDWIPIGLLKNGSFSGTFDGNGHTITINGKIDIEETITKNMYSTIFVGLFSINSGTVKNLHVTGDFTCASGTVTLYLGAIAGSNAGKISNCVSTANISGNGGLLNARRGAANFFLGAASNSVILYQNGAYVGGITGVNNNLISNCYSESNISVTGKGYKSAGGIVGGNGFSNRGTIINCYTTGNISASEDDGVRFAGGIAGMNMFDASISNCVALNKEISTVGRSRGLRMDGMGINMPNNANCSVGINYAAPSSRNRNGLLQNVYYRHDMQVTKEKEEQEAQDGEPDRNVNSGDDNSSAFRIRNRGVSVNMADTQDQSWWIGEPKNFEFSFGTDDSAPWIWDEALQRPKLYWETIK